MSLFDIDPYFLNQKEVSTSISHLRQMLADREDMLHDVRGVNPEVFKSVGINIQKELQQARNLLQDISDSIQMARSNPSRFQINDVELNNRDYFYNSSMKELDDIENQMNVQTSNQRIQFTFQPVPISPVPQEDIIPNQQYTLQQRQEEQIDQIALAVNEQKEIGKMIINEIDEQRQIIIDLDENIENASQAMKQVTNQISKLIENEGKVPTLLVAGLSLVLIFMLFIVA